MNKNAKDLLKSNLLNMYNHTQNWIEDVEFYEEELTFFNTLISERIDSITTDNLDHKIIFRHIDDLLYKLSKDIIIQIKEHRKELSLLLEANNITENQAEVKIHLHLLEKMATVKHGIKKLKKALFAYIEDHPFNFDFDTIFKEL